MLMSIVKWLLILIVTYMFFVYIYSTFVLTKMNVKTMKSIKDTYRIFREHGYKPLTAILIIAIHEPPLRLAFYTANLINYIKRRLNRDGLQKER